MCGVMNAVLADGKYVPAGTIITSQNQADHMPDIDDNYSLGKLNNNVIHVNVSLANGYNKHFNGSE